MIKKYMKIKVDNQLKKDFENNFKNKYNKISDIYEIEIEKLLKFILAVNGHDSYQDDPDVLEMLDMVDSKFTSGCTHEISEISLVNTIEEEIEKPKTSKNRNRDIYVKGFLSTFKDNLQVSKEDIDKYSIRTDKISDTRALKSRIKYLEAFNIIKAIEPDIYMINRLKTE